MKKLWMFKAALLTAVLLGSNPSTLTAHCQMPCGIYHDAMIYDLIDQYAETMAKAVTVMNQSKFETVREKNEFVRWVMEKEKESNDTSQLITSFFLQQKIKSGEADTQKRTESAHKLLCLIVAIKQNADIKIVESFTEEWEKFKLMFHVEEYECKMEQKRMKKRQQLLEKHGDGADDHNHDHDHTHNDSDHKH